MAAKVRFTMLIAPLPAAIPSPSPIPALEGAATGAPSANVAVDGLGQVPSDQNAQGTQLSGAALSGPGGKTGNLKASGGGSDPISSPSQAGGADFAQALAASLGAQTPQATVPAQIQSDANVPSSAPSIAAGPFTGLLTPAAQIDFAAQQDAPLVTDGTEPAATISSSINGDPLTSAFAPSSLAEPAQTLSAALGLSQTLAPPAQLQPGPAPSPDLAPSPSKTASETPIAPAVADAPRPVPNNDGALLVQSRSVDPSPVDQASGSMPLTTPNLQTASAPPPSSAADRPAPLSTSNPASARSVSARGALSKSAPQAAGSLQAQAASSGTLQTASTSLSNTPGGDPRNGGGEEDNAGAQTPRTGQADDSAAQTAPPAQPDASALAGSLQAQAASPPQSTTPKADARTVSQLSAQIVQTLNGAKSSFDMTLHPEGLGDVQVKVSVDRNGAVTASMSFNNPQAAAELGARVGDLRDALSQAGFTVADNGLSFNMSGQDQSGAGQGGWSQGADPSAGRAFIAARDNSEDLLAAVSQAAANLQRPPAAGLDIRI